MMERHDLAPKKTLGQNFLFDLNLTAKIARASGPLSGATVVEIGPGPGGLTRALLAAGAERIFAIERDTRCLPVLHEIAAQASGRLTVIAADALTFDWQSLPNVRDARIVANLPYNIGTALLLGWLTGPDWPPWYESLTLMFQREVAERIVAGPDQPKAYGRLGVLAGWRASARILFDVPAAAFSPPPKVVSSVVRLVPRPQPLPCDLGVLEQVTAQAFGQRRKMLRQSLRAFGDAEAILAQAGLDPTARPEIIPVAGFVALANAVAESVGSRQKDPTLARSPGDILGC